MPDTAARVKAQEDAVRFLTKARNGQLKYLGPGKYLKKICDKLQIAENFDVDVGRAEEEGDENAADDESAGRPPAVKKARLSRE